MVGSEEQVNGHKSECAFFKSEEVSVSTIP